MAPTRDERGRFYVEATRKTSRGIQSVKRDHNYESGHTCENDPCNDSDCPLFNNIKLGKYAEKDSWKDGRRIIELGTLLENLRSCRYCRLGPVPLTCLNIVGELRKGLGGYLYVKCLNVECGEVNLVPYGKTHRNKKNKAGMPSFVINTKLGIGKLILIFIVIFYDINYKFNQVDVI